MQKRFQVQETTRNSLKKDKNQNQPMSLLRAKSIDLKNLRLLVLQ